MSPSNRVAKGRNKPMKIGASTVKNENAKHASKNKKALLSQKMADKVDSKELTEKIKKLMEFTQKPEEEVIAALHDYDNDENSAINFLLEGKQDNWVTKKKKNKSRPTAKEEAISNEDGGFEGNCNDDEWDESAILFSPACNVGSKPGRGGSSRGGYGDRGRWPRRDGKENDRRYDDRNGDSERRGYRSRDGNGPSRYGSGGRGSRRGRGTGGSRGYPRDRDGGEFPRQIDTWNNPEAESDKRNDFFPSPDDWDNEEYTGSLAVTFTSRSTTLVKEVSDDGEIGGIMEENGGDEISASLDASLIVGNNNQLSVAQSQFFSQLQTASKVGVVVTSAPSSLSSVIYNSSSNSVSAKGMAYAAVASAQTFASISAQPAYISAVPQQPAVQPVAPPPTQAYQSPPASTAASFDQKQQQDSYETHTSGDYPSSNFSEVLNYNAMGTGTSLQSLPQRSAGKTPLASNSRHGTPTKTVSNTDEAVVDANMTFLGTKFGTLEITGKGIGGYGGDGTVGDQVTGAGSKYAAVVSSSPAGLTFESSNHSRPSMAAVLSQNSKLPLADSTRQVEEGCIYSSQPSRIPSSGLQEGKAATSMATATVDSPVNLTSYMDSKPGYQGGNMAQKGREQQPQHQQQPQQSFNPKQNTGYLSNVGTSAANYASNFGNSPPVVTTASSIIYSTQQQQQQQQQTTGSSFSIYNSSNNPVVAAAVLVPSVTTTANQSTTLANSIYHNSSFQGGQASVTASFQSYLSYPGSIIPTYQAGASVTPYMSTAPYSVASTIPYGTSAHNFSAHSTVTTTTAAPSKLNSVMANSKESQYETLQQSSVSATSSLASTSGPVMGSGLTTATSSAGSRSVTATTTGAKNNVMIPPGVAAPLVPQYIMGQGPPMYQPTAFLNMDELYLGRYAAPPPHVGGYVDMNYGMQSNPTGSRDMPFSSDRFSRPDTATSPAAPGNSISQQSGTSNHQQPIMNPMQTFAYIYPQFPQTYTPMFSVPAPGGNHASSATSITRLGTGYGSASNYASQFEGSGTNSNTGGNYGNSAPGRSIGGGAGGTGGSMGGGTVDLTATAYKTHSTLGKYDKPFQSPQQQQQQYGGISGSGGGNTNGMGGGMNANVATGYMPQMFIQGGSQGGPHHLQQNAHQDGADGRNAPSENRGYYMTNRSAGYR